MRYFLAIFLFLIVATLSILGFRGSKSTKPPLEVFPDMDRQARYKPQGASAFFADSRADRPVVPGTVPRGSFVEDDYYATGKLNGQFSRGHPLPVTYEFMALGREKYTIFCTVCHGASGDGDGITKSYDMIATPSYHNDRLRDMSEGEIFNTITHGKNNMGAYGAKLGLRERWAIIAYLRALQRAQNAAIEDVSPENRVELGL